MAAVLEGVLEKYEIQENQAVIEFCLPFRRKTETHILQGRGAKNFCDNRMYFEKGDWIRLAFGTAVLLKKGVRRKKN